MLAEVKEKFSEFLGALNAIAGVEQRTHSNIDADDLIRQQFDHHYLADLLPYEAYDEETNLYINKQSIGFVLEGSLLLGTNDEVESILTSIIQKLPHFVDVQFILWGSPKIEEVFNAFSESQSAGEIFKWLAQKRCSFLEKGAYESLTKQDPLILKDLRLFISVSMLKKRTGGIEQLITVRDLLQSSLTSINMATINMLPSHFKSVFSDILIPKRDLSPSNMPWDRLNCLSSQLTNSQWSMQPTPDQLEFWSQDEKISTRSLTVANYPEAMTLWKMPENLGHMFNSNMQLPCPFVVSFSFRKLDREDFSNTASARENSADKDSKTKLKKYNPLLNKEQQEWQHVRERLAEGEEVVSTFYQITLFAPPDKLNAYENKIGDLYKANGWTLRRESYLQVQTWLSNFPFMMTEGLYEDLKRAKRLKKMFSTNAICIAPIQGDWKGTKSPGLLLPSRRGQLAQWSPFDNEAGNYNIAIAAASGRGKSVFVQEYIRSVLGRGGLIRVIDRGRSYEKICKLLGGEFIEFKEDKPICLNPFTHVNDIDEALPQLTILLATMARPINGANEIELVFIEKAIKETWLTYKNDTTITKIVKWLKNQTQEDDKIHCIDLATLFYSFTKAGMYGKYFEGEATINLKNSFVVLELQELAKKPALQKIILMLLMHQINFDMYLTERTRQKSCIIDEAWALLGSNEPQAASFIQEGYRTARRFGGNYLAISQDFSTFFMSTMAEAAYTCSDFKIILGQTEEEITKMRQREELISDGFTERLFKSLRLTRDYSECVIKGPGGMTLHRLILDPYSRILFSTKGNEFDAVNKLVSAGIPLIEAIEQVARNAYA